MLFFFILSINFYKLKFILKFNGLILLIVYVFISILLGSKFDLFMFLIPFICGLMLSSDKLLTNAFCLILIFISFFLSSLITTELRNYYALNNNIESSNLKNESFNILKIFIDAPKKKFDTKNNNKYFQSNKLDKFKTGNHFLDSSIKIIHNLGYRFDVAFIQRFLIYQYDSSYKGNSLSDFYIFIPRLLWKYCRCISIL